MSTGSFPCFFIGTFLWGLFPNQVSKEIGGRENLQIEHRIFVVFPHITEVSADPNAKSECSDSDTSDRHSSSTSPRNADWDRSPSTGF